MLDTLPELMNSRMEDWRPPRPALSCAGAGFSDDYPLGRSQRSIGCMEFAAGACIRQTCRVSTRIPVANTFLLFAAAFWSVFGIVAGSLVWLSMLTHGHSPPLLLGFHLLVWLAWLGPTYIIVWLAR